MRLGNISDLGFRLRNVEDLGFRAAGIHALLKIDAQPIHEFLRALVPIHPLLSLPLRAGIRRGAVDKRTRTAPPRVRPR